MLDERWIEHRRSGDKERLGWMIPTGDGFVAVDLLGRWQTEEVDWLTAEQTLDELGIGYLADRYELLLAGGTWLRVRITEVSPDGIRLTKDDWGVIGAADRNYLIRFPATSDLRICTAD